MRARDIMTTPVTAVRPETPIKEAATLLAGNGFTALPVVDSDERLVGIVTEADLMRDRLEIYGGDRRWRVEVHDGMVSIRDQFDGDQGDAETDRHVATVLAEAVPGVVRAAASATHEENDR